MALVTLMFVAVSWFTVKPEEVPEVYGSMESSVVTSAVVVLSERCGSLPATMPRVLSQTNQSPVESVRFIITKRAVAVKAALMFFVLPLPVYEPTFDTPGLEAKR